MIAILSALIGFASSALPECFSLFRESKDRSHEIAILQMQLEQERMKIAANAQQQQAVIAQQVEAIGVQRDMTETLALNARIKDSLIGISWVDALAGSVRPVLTYVFCLMYGLVKLAQYQLLIHPELPWQTATSSHQAMVMLWNDEDMALFTAIIAFWFGQRMFSKAKKGLL